MSDKKKESSKELSEAELDAVSGGGGEKYQGYVDEKTKKASPKPINPAKKADLDKMEKKVGPHPDSFQARVKKKK